MNSVGKHPQQPLKLQTKIVMATDKNDEAYTCAQAALNQSAVVAIPTETVYGLAGSAFSEEAVLKIFKSKERPSFDPLIVHTFYDKARGAETFLKRLDAEGIISLSILGVEARTVYLKLIETFMPGPLTLVFPKGPKIVDPVTSGLATVAVRCPAQPWLEGLLRRLSFPLAAPSANKFGRISPVTAQDVFSELEGSIDLIIDGGPCQVGLESTILSHPSVLEPHTNNPQATTRPMALLRYGGLAVEAIEAALGTSVSRPIQLESSASESPSLHSPGTLTDHYAPRTKLLKVSRAIDDEADYHSLRHELSRRGFAPSLQIGYLSLVPCPRVSNYFHKQIALIEDSSVVERQGSSEFTHIDTIAARNLFQSLRALDNAKLDLLVCDDLEAQGYTARHGGLFYAIAERLNKAAHLKETVHF